MSTVSLSYERFGRTDQKARTRDALVTAARRLIAEGVAEPTVQEAAQAAAISRTTAYRYFPNQRSLLVAAHPEMAAASLVPVDVDADPKERLATVVQAFIDLIVDTEQQQRTMLRLSLEQGTDPDHLPLRRGRAIRWFEDALDGLTPQLGADTIHQLAVAIRSAVGIESLVWLLDIAGLTHEQAGELMQWSAQAMLEYALTGETDTLFKPQLDKDEEL